MTFSLIPRPVRRKGTVDLFQQRTRRYSLFAMGAVKSQAYYGVRNKARCRSFDFANWVASVSRDLWLPDKPVRLIPAKRTNHPRHCFQLMRQKAPYALTISKCIVNLETIYAGEGDYDQMLKKRLNNSVVGPYGRTRY